MWISADAAPLTPNEVQEFFCTVSAGEKNFMLLDFLSALEPLRRLELPVVALKHRKAALTLAQAQNSAPGMLDPASRLEPHLEHDSADATAFGDSGLRMIMATHFSDLANESDRPLPHRKNRSRRQIP